MYIFESFVTFLNKKKKKLCKSRLRKREEKYIHQVLLRKNYFPLAKPSFSKIDVN